jgi:hypothetical protein
MTCFVKAPACDLSYAYKGDLAVTHASFSLTHCKTVRRICVEIGYQTGFVSYLSCFACFLLENVYL